MAEQILEGKVVLVTGAGNGIGATMVEKVKARDKLLAERGPSAPIPRCSACHQELAYPYRKAGVHPECAADKPGHSTW